MKIAVIGCTGQIGRCLVRSFAANHDLMLYARRPKIMQAWLKDRDLAAEIFDLADFPKGDFDLVINAIGDGIPGKIRAVGAQILETTEHFDSQCLDHLDRNPDRAYVFLSTGRIYGEEYEAARQPDPTPLPLEHLAEHPYPLAKLQAEHRHRKRSHQRIADIRIFGFVSDEIGLDDDFLVAQMYRALVDKADFITRPHDLVRDYVGSEDLAELINRLMEADVPNAAYDLCSTRPVTKLELLEALAEDFGFHYRVDDAMPDRCQAPHLISDHDATRKIGYEPSRTSMQNVLRTADAILRRRQHSDRCRLP